MLMGRVIGEVVATRKHPSHEGRKLLLVQPLNLDESDRGNALIAVDSVQAGIGDKVLLTTDGYSAFTALGLTSAPVDTAVIGIIDSFDVSFGVSIASPAAS